METGIVEVTGSDRAGGGALTGSGSTLTFVDAVAGSGTELMGDVPVGVVVDATEVDGSALVAAG